MTVQDFKTMSTEALFEIIDTVSAELLKRSKPQLFHLVSKVYVEQGRTHAIKLVRESENNGLGPAKIIVDYWARSENWTAPTFVETLSV